MAATIIFHRLALREYDAAWRWYAQRSSWAAQRFQDEVEHSLQKIAATPDRWPMFHNRFRGLRVRRFPYVLYYHILDADHLLIMAVAHASRRPGYWLRRSRP